MAVTVLRLGATALSLPSEGSAAVLNLPASPDRNELRDALATAESGDGLVVAAGVPGLSAVLTRLYRASALDRTPLGWVPAADPTSAELAAVLGLPTEPGAAWAVAVGGVVRPLILVRDDQGGLLLHRGVVTAAAGGDLGAQAYHDDLLAVNGRVASIEVRPAYDRDGWGAPAPKPVDAVHVAVRRRRRIGRARITHSVGRAIQIAAEPATVVVDGVQHPRPLARRTWYSDDRARWLLRVPG